MNRPRLFSTPCNSDFGEICTSLNTFGVTENGYNIFDAIAGAPGTYIYYSTNGSLSFGFSEDLYLSTQNYIDGQNKARASLQDRSYLTGYGFNVYVRDWGAGFQSVSGLLFDLASIDPSQVEAEAIANMPISVSASYESAIASERAPASISTQETERNAMKISSCRNFSRISKSATGSLRVVPVERSPEFPWVAMEPSTWHFATPNFFRP